MSDITNFVIMSTNSPSTFDDVLVPPVVVPSPTVAARHSPTLTPTSESAGLNVGACDWTDVHEDESGNAAGILATAGTS